MVDVIAPYLVYIAMGKQLPLPQQTGVGGSINTLKSVYSSQDVKEWELNPSKLRTRLFS